MNMHPRYAQQAGWTRQLRRHAYQATRLASAQCLLEVGCGTGVLLNELSEIAPGGVYAMDIDIHALRSAAGRAPQSRLACADALRLPFPQGCFDASLCHFVLLWVADPSQAVREMMRITRPGGTILALAEPDYGGRIDYPPELARLGELQTAALRRQGADPRLGSRLSHLFHEAGLERVQVGTLGGQWSMPPTRQEFELEWQVLRADLAGALSDAKLDELQKQDWEAYQRGERILYVPTFYAWGFCPNQ
ncbi:MAG: methyltransferase domain-containing protein [Anaerolineales bacterium]|nr:methyltransferase domain-containing protein [Anaerolineales bacterium]